MSKGTIAADVLVRFEVSIDPLRLKLLKLYLVTIKEADDRKDYDRRFGYILQAMYLARELGYSAGFRIDLDCLHWPVAFIELPTGQVSWHMPEHEIAWDGHTNEEKYNRIGAFLALEPEEAGITIQVKGEG